MENSIKNYIDTLFLDFPDTNEVRDAKQRITKDTIAKYQTMVNDGCDAASAFQKAIESIEDISELKKSITEDKKVNPRISALPKSVQGYANKYDDDSVKAVYKKSGNGKIVAIGCLTGFIIFLLAVALIIAIGVLVVRTISPTTFVDIDDMSPSEVLDSVKDALKDNYVSFDGAAVNADDNEVTIGSAWSEDHEIFVCEYKSDGTYSVPADNINNIEIDWVAGEILIVAEDRDDILINEEINTRDPICYGVKNGTLYIYYRDKIEQSQYKMSIKSVTIRIPAELAKSLNELEIESISADCRIENAELYKTDFETISGSFILESNCSYVDFESTNGDFTYNSSICPIEADISTISGDITFYISSNSGFTVEYDTISGDIKSDFSMEKLDSETYCCGDGSAIIEVQSTSGDILIKEK